MTTPVPGPLPYRTRLEVWQDVIAALTHLDTEGSMPDGSDGRPWTSGEIGEAYAAMVLLWFNFTREVRAAAEGRAPDPADFLRRAALNVAANPPTGPFGGTYIEEDQPPAPWNET